MSGWEGKVDVYIISEPTAAINGRLKSLPVEQRRGLGVYLEDIEHSRVLDIGHTTGVRHTLAKALPTANSDRILL